MFTLPRIFSDIRRSVGHQGYDITYGGVPKETGPGPYGSALPATYKTQFWAKIMTNANGLQTFSLPPGLYAAQTLTDGATVVRPGTGTPLAAITVSDSTIADIDLFAALALGVAAQSPTAFEEAYPFVETALDRGRLLEVTVSGATANDDPENYALVGFDLWVVPTAWK